MPSIFDYGTPEQPNLEGISKALLLPLQCYNGVLLKEGVRIYGDPLLKLTPEKTNTARVVLDVLTLRGERVGDLYIILFAPGDGTGKIQDYTIGLRDAKLFRRAKDGLEIKGPEGYHFPKERTQVLPRNKLAEGVLCEAFLPLCSVEGRFIYPYMVSLEQITVDNIIQPTALVRGLELGILPKYMSHPPSQPLHSSPPPPIQLTCGYRRTGERFGDPHATFYNPALATGRPNLMQVAGFLAVESTDNPLCKILDRIATAPQ